MKKIIILIIAIAAIFAVWYFFFRVDKKKAIKIIVESGMNKNTNGFLDSAGESYVVNWGKAIKKGETTFSDSGKIYSVMGGKAV